MEKKYLRLIAIVAAVLTGLMIIYTIIATFSANREEASTTPPASQVSTPQPSAGGQQVDKLFPVQLAGMNRVDVLTGQKAIDSVSQMHGTSIQAVNAYVVSYKGQGQEQMMIWVSDAKDQVDGRALFDAMDAKMPKTQYFQNYKTVNIAGQEYRSVTSQDGMQHYYWLKGVRNIWVGVIAPTPSEVLKQVAPLF